MAARARPWTSIVAATDFSAPGVAAVATAAGLAARGGSVTLVHAVELPPFNIQMLLKVQGVAPRKAWLEGAKVKLERRAARIRRPGLAVETRARIGRPWKVILDVAADRGAELVVVGRSGHSRIERLLLGSTAERVVRLSPVAVLVVGRRALGPIRRVLLPFDESEGSRRALELAAERLPRSAAIEALHVVPRSVAPWMPTEEELRRKLRPLLASANKRRARLTVAVDSGPAEGILRRAARGRFDLVVLATHGRRGVARALLGSVAEKVLRHARPPVLVVPGPRGRGRRTRR